MIDERIASFALDEPRNTGPPSECATTVSFFPSSPPTPADVSCVLSRGAVSAIGVLRLS
jgi:hypothetical protein